MPQQPPSERHFSVSQARREGQRRAEWDAPTLLRPHHGARTVGASAGEPLDDITDAKGHIEALRALAPVLAEHAFFVGPSAAALWGMPVPRTTLTELHVGVRYPATPPRRFGVRGRRFRANVVRTESVQGLPSLSAPEAWASLGKHLCVDDLVAAADALLWIPRNPGGFHPELLTGPLCKIHDLRNALAAGQWLGSMRLRWALPLASTGSHSHPETLMRLRWLEAELPSPALNADIYEGDAWLGNVDAAFAAYKVRVEYQGAHHRDAQTYQADVDRMFRLRQAGWLMVELTSAHVLKTPDEGVRRVRNALMDRGWRPSTP
ncbi:hypothetical protein DWB68_13825 [Galactobacter valiniphilus]|uniref:DUF559 domain-containing protein n=1 Tax=Galactobacter valiniphilus TaxID=2676122 RepID=A0A399J6V5_9MICC|nr:hypothetical protein [Galactobacter valiniphilus]RII41208.1 hypothetical protein DWB68_13825 [Galactobacter valiniphilus]